MEKSRIGSGGKSNKVSFNLDRAARASTEYGATIITHEWFVDQSFSAVRAKSIRTASGTRASLHERLERIESKS